MSNRYVWQQSSVARSINDTSTVTDFVRRNVPIQATGDAYVDYYSELHVNQNGQIEGTKSSTKKANGYAPEYSVDNNSYFHPYYKSADGDVVDFVANGGSDISRPYFFKSVANTKLVVYGQLVTQPYTADLYVNNAIPIGVSTTKGVLVGTVSNSGASTYPPRDYPSKSARIWPYSAPGMRGSGRASTSMYPLLGAALTM